MEYFQPQQANLSELCRGCLSKCDNMIDLSPENPETPQMVAMLAAVGNFEIEINDSLPSYLCDICEEKLRSSYDFQMLLQHSNETLKQYLQNDEITMQEEDSIEPINETKDVKDENVSEAESDDGHCNTKLIQVSNKEVDREIAVFKARPTASLACVQCEYKAGNIRALSIHMTHVHRELRTSWCFKCNSLVDNLEEHKLNHTMNDQRCKFCMKVFMGRGHFIAHLLAHAKKRPFKCHLCTNSYLLQRHLDQHLLKHGKRDENIKDEPGNDASDESNRLNFCTICQRRVRSLKEHQRLTHSGLQTVQNEFLCTACGKIFRSRSKLSIHMRMHTGETPYECSHCHRKMPCRSQLVVHLRTHTGEKPHSCKICGKTFAQTSSLNTHMRLHTGRSDRCEMCGKTFCRPAQLRNHMRKHTGEKPYVCHICGQAFVQSSHLVGHMKTHSDERPYKCVHCMKTFKVESTLKSHMFIHLGEKPFKCKYCTYACRQSYSLTQHMNRQHHNEEQQN